MANPQTPKILKGAIAAYDESFSRPTVIEFQINPETQARTLEPKIGGGDGAQGEVGRVAGPPGEAIKLDCMIDATDGLEAGDPEVIAHGIAPQLAALEVLVYPHSGHVKRNLNLLSIGTLEVLPPPATFTVFIWGKSRILPVRLTELSITEEAFDPNLNPIRAKLSLGMTVLTYVDLPRGHPGHALFLAHQEGKERMARNASGSSFDAALGGAKPF